MGQRRLAAVDGLAGGSEAGRVWPGWRLLAVAAYAVLCVLVLSVTPRLAEPDDYAYRASIVAMTEGHFLTVTARRPAPVPLPPGSAAPPARG
jgi:hypothetical protein